MHGKAPLILTIVAAAALSLGATEAPTNRDDARALRACVDPPSDGATWTPMNDHTILVWQGQRAFQLTTNKCPSLGDRLPRITTVLSGGSNICSPRDVKIYVSDSADRMGVPCFVQSITPLSLEEGKALERANRR